MATEKGNDEDGYYRKESVESIIEASDKDIAKDAEEIAAALVTVEPDKVNLKVRTINYETLEKYSGRGLRITEICAVLGISQDTYRQKLAKDEQFRQAIHRGKARLNLQMHDVVTDIALDPYADDSDRLRAAGMILKAHNESFKDGPTTQISIENEIDKVEVTVLTKDQMLRAAQAYVRLNGNTEDSEVENGPSV